MSRTQPDRIPPVAVPLMTPSVARVYDYYLGGDTNWTVDREFARHVLERFPIMRQIALMHREFLARVVRYLCDRGITQFLDIGSGIPAHGSAHRVADGFAFSLGKRPDARVIYIDNDPIAVGHGRMCLREHGDVRRHRFLNADTRDPRDLWRQVRNERLLNLDQPIAVLLVGFLHLQQPNIRGRDIGPISIQKLLSYLPPDTFIAVSHVTDEGVPESVADSLIGLRATYDEAACRTGAGRVTWRSRTQISELVPQVQPVSPGWVPALDWNPNHRDPREPEAPIPPAGRSAVWAALGRKSAR